MKKLLPALAVATIALSGCSTAEKGTPSPIETGGSRPAASASNSAAPSSGLSEADACELTKGITAEFQLTEIEEKGAGHCQARMPDLKTLGIDVYPDLGVAQYNPGQQASSSDIDVNGRPAKLVEKALTKFDCVVVLGVTEDSRVDVFVATTDPAQSCEIARRVAKAVEPALPRG